MDDVLVRYLLDDLSPDERAQVEARLASDASFSRDYRKLQRVLAALTADSPDPVPPRGLALATIHRTAQAWIADGLFGPAEAVPTTPPRPALAGRAAAAWRMVGGDMVFAAGRRADALVAAAVAVLVIGVGLSAVGKLRFESQVRACQDHLRELHTALAGYADTRRGYYPQVGTLAVPDAGSVAAELVRAGHLRAVSVASCPIGSPTDTFAYTLGYLGPAGQVIGPRRIGGDESAADWFPISADPAWASHGAGPNILFAAGNVRHASSPLIGPHGDNIYHNDHGLVRAGLHSLDASLGTAGDIP